MLPSSTTRTQAKGQLVNFVWSKSPSILWSRNSSVSVMEEACRRRSKWTRSRPPPLPDRERELEREAALDAQVGKIMAVRRQLITDLDAVVDRLARLGHDLRRLQPFPPSHRGQGGRRLISRVVG